MSIEIIPRIIVLVCVAIAILGLLIGVLIYQINRKKGLVGILLAVVFAVITGYYCYLFFFPLSTYTTITHYPKIQKAKLVPEQTPVLVIFETEDGSKFVVEDGDYLEINSDVKIKVTEVRQNNIPIENVRVNVIGFTPVNNPSTNNDIGYAFSYRNLKSKFAIDQEKSIYRTEVKKGDEKIGEVFLKFIR
ncbi:MAG: hypothetical protein NC937_06800 [Candidatus Omnitrophica bacterium]|nr:hypothetical protein [Candidatus Omnitrophota bacterium]